jgi:guanylate kinase
MTKGKVFIISGPSGSGKTTLYKRLLSEEKRLVKSISVTTRAPREGEQHGREYFFVTQKMFLHKKKTGQFLESQKVFDNYYGTPKENIEKSLNEGKNILLCIDVKGAKVVRQLLPQAITIFVKTPSMETLRKRLTLRGSENTKTIDLRVKTAEKELKEAKYYKHVIVNCDLNTAFKELREIINTELNRV